MKRKAASVLLFISIIFSTLPAVASSGALRKASICFKNNVAYGQHGDGHWHRAVKRGERWYAVGGSLGTQSPCN